MTDCIGQPTETPEPPPLGGMFVLTAEAEVIPGEPEPEEEPQ